MIAVQTCAIAFDIDHTLAIDNKLERIAFLRLLARIDGEGGRLLGTLDQETSAIDALLERQRSGAFTIDDAVRRFVSERGVTHTKPFVEHFREIVLSLVDHVVVPLPGVPRMLDELRARGIATAVLSNGWSPLQQRKAERAGFAGPVLASADVGAAKPDRSAFAALVDRLGLPAQCIWYVGDNPRTDVAGAHAAGLRTAWYNAEGRRYPGDLTPPDAVIADICDAVGLVTLAVGS
ncbi:MAG TPA: HAD family hydrolase [Candidatus Dormibacteraeota bacterium]|nr:HAD family hydrolase [Candidatus Dormibacteraeota bacterium]